MRLGNYLKGAGATDMTGRPVKFQIMSKDKSGNPVSRMVEATILPLSEAERCKTIREAREYIDRNPLDGLDEPLTPANLITSAENDPQAAAA